MFTETKLEKKFFHGFAWVFIELQLWYGFQYAIVTSVWTKHDVPAFYTRNGKLKIQNKFIQNHN